MRHIPTALYIDTQVFMNQGLRLDTKAFRLLKNTFVKGGLRLLVPAVMERELLRHYRTRAEECAQAIKKTKAMHPLPVLEMLTPRPRNEVIDACFNRLESEWAYSFTVHPRARGEHPQNPFSSCAICGSSPRSRGTFQQGAYRFVLVRFLPALAGRWIHI